jgi:hypothetical protein
VLVATNKNSGIDNWGYKRYGESRKPLIEGIILLSTLLAPAYDFGRESARVDKERGIGIDGNRKMKSEFTWSFRQRT